MGNKRKNIQFKDTILLEKMIIENMDNICLYIMKYKDCLRDFEDMKQEMIKEFIVAVPSYNSNYKSFKIYIKRILYIRHIQYLLNNLEQFKDEDEKYAFCVKVYEKCKNKLGYDPACKELAKYWGVNYKAAHRVKECVCGDINPLINYFGDDTIEIEEPVLEDMTREEQSIEIKKSKLGIRQKEVLLYYYGFLNGKRYNIIEMENMLDGAKQSYSKANELLIKKIKKKINRS